MAQPIADVISNQDSPRLTVNLDHSSSASEQVDSSGSFSIPDNAASTSVPSQNSSTSNRSPLQVQEYHSTTLTTRDYLASDLSDESQPSGSSSHPETSLHQHSYLQFECGCGKCSVYDYISGKICPNPMEVPFPKFEVSEIPPEEIEYIEEELRDQTKSIYREFCALASDTFKALREQVDYSELISYLKLVSSPRWDLQYALAASKSEDTFECVKPSNLLEHVIDKNYCSWFDYDLIQHLRERYLFPSVNDEDKALNDYKEHFKHYVNRRCFLYLHNSGPRSKNQVVVKCKLDFEYRTLSQKVIKHLKYVFAKTIGAPAYHLAFKTAQEGCTELTFGAPPYFNYITQLSNYQISQLKVHGFVKIAVADRNLLQSRNHEGSGIL